MDKFKPQDRRQKKFFLWLAVAVLAVLIAVAIRGAWGAYFKEKESRFYRDDASTRLLTLKEREETLQKDIERLNTETGLEEEIRKRFNVTKEGEEVIVLIDTPEGGDSNVVVERGIWRIIKNWFGF